MKSRLVFPYLPGARLMMICLACVLIALIARADSSPMAAVEGTPSSIAGNTYTNPTYDYMLTWDETWEVEELAVLPDGRERLALNSVLGDDAFFVLVPQTRFGGDACVADYIEITETDPNFAGVKPGLGDDGRPLAGSGPDRSYAVITHTAEIIFDFIQYVECRTLVPGKVVLMIVYFYGELPQLAGLTQDAQLEESAKLPQAQDYDAQAARLESLLATLSLPSGTPVAAGTVGPTVSKLAFDTGGASALGLAGAVLPLMAQQDLSPTVAAGGTPSSVVGNTYTNPTYGYALTWDETWKVEELVALPDGSEGLVLNSVLSDNSFFSVIPHMRFSSDTSACVAERIEELENHPNVANVNLVLGPDSRPLEESGPDSYYAVIAYDQEIIFNSVQYVECRSLVPGEAVLRIVFLVDAEDYEAQATRLESLLASLSLPQATPAASPAATPIQPETT